MTLDDLLARTVPGPGGCQLWTGARDRDGYGTVWADGRTWRTHRLVVVLVYGSSPHPRAVATHDCDTPGCINPGHLRWGTPLSNMAEALARGRVRGTWARCMRGHPKLGPGADVYVTPYRVAQCRACRRLTARARRRVASAVTQRAA